MGSTGEADRKRRHFSSISPTAAAAKKQPFAPLSEDKKLDTAVLQFQNQKLVQKLEAQKIEITSLEEKISKLQERQLPYENNLVVVNKSLEELVDDLEAHCSLTKNLMRCEPGLKNQFVKCSEQHVTLTDDVSSSKDASPSEDCFLSRLLVTGATESSFTTSITTGYLGEDKSKEAEKIKNVLHDIAASFDSQSLVDKLHRSHQLGTSIELQAETKKLRLEVSNLLIKHVALTGQLQNHMDREAKNKAELRHLKEELESTVAELEASNRTLAILKAEKDATKGAFFPVLNLTNRPLVSDKARDKNKELRDLESALKELLDQSSSRLRELKRLNDERTVILKQLGSLQNTLKNFKCICSSRAYRFLKDQLMKAKACVIQNQALFEKLQVERDSLSWREKEMYVKNELVDFHNRSATAADSRISDLEKEMEKQRNEKNLIAARLDEASQGPSRKEIIAEFRTLLSSFPDEMGTMQTQLSKFKESASDVHTLRADVKSISKILERKAEKLRKLSARSSEQAAEIQKLHAFMHDLNTSDKELKLFSRMLKREAFSSRDVIEAQDSEFKAWACVQSLKISLDEHNLELRVKTAIEAEATSQQRLAATEAEIAELRQKLDTSTREQSRDSEVLKSKHEETEAYLSEIETIGQAYDDMQTQNQQLLQQVTERDDYNIKLYLEGVRARQIRDGLHMEKQTMEKAIQLVNGAVDCHNMKVLRIEDQLKICSDQIERLAENRVKSTGVLESNEKRTVEVRKSCEQLKETIEEMHLKVDGGRVGLAQLQIETEEERFKRKREVEDLEFLRSKASRLNSNTEGSSALDKLRQEIREYREILKCSICLDRRKEVVIGKCYHLFCNPCVQKIIETRQRKCPVCAASFGVNDVKPVYI